MTMLLVTAVVDRLMMPVNLLLIWMNNTMGHLYSPFALRLLHLFLVSFYIKMKSIFPSKCNGYIFSQIFLGIVMISLLFCQINCITWFFPTVFVMMYPFIFFLFQHGLNTDCMSPSEKYHCDLSTAVVTWLKNCFVYHVSDVLFLIQTYDFIVRSQNTTYISSTTFTSSRITYTLPS